MHRVIRTAMVCACVAVAGSLAACGGGADSASGAGPASSSSTVAGATLSGPRADAAVADQLYEYVPETGDFAANAVAFSIENKPAWATFDAAGGVLRGTPTRADIGAKSTVRITAAAGSTRQVLEFQLQVVATAEGVVSIALGAPLTRTDGSALANLAGYRIYYGKTATRLDQFVDVKDGRATSADVRSLTPGTWHFAATAYDANGLESDATDVASKTVV